ncbi:hypothetical protein KSS87_008095 [Heliosperma pusillum]|nr:hypothetical protein KSS87_008095 [Heliosperma pusillum]
MMLTPSSLVYEQVQIMEPAVKGTLNVLKACTETKAQRVVYVSSMAAVAMNPNWPVGQVMDESCWSDKDYCKRTDVSNSIAQLTQLRWDDLNLWSDHVNMQALLTFSDLIMSLQNWYCASKTEAEIEAFEYAKTSGLDVVSVCPTLVLGPMMQPTVNSSSLVLIKLLKEGYESTENKIRRIVDVRDLVAALLLVYEKPEAEGRYLCTSHQARVREIVDKLKQTYPHYNYPKNITEVADEMKISSEKLQKLGWSYRSLEETLIDSVESYKELGLLN